MKTTRPDTAVLVDRDGQERKFLLTRGGINRLREKLGCKTLADVLQKVATDEEGAMGLFFYECLLDKKDLTQEQFEDLMVFNIEADQAAIAKILGASMPKESAPVAGRPTEKQLSLTQ